jgi:hypothetical protein
LGQVAQDYVHILYARPKTIAVGPGGLDDLLRAVEHVRASLDPTCTARINGVDSVNNPTEKPVDATTGFRPFAASCPDQIDGGFFAAVGRLRESRLLVADPARSIAVIASAIDHPGAPDSIFVKAVGTIAMPEAFRAPSTSIQVAVISVRDGHITHVETVERPVFYGMSLGW